MHRNGLEDEADFKPNPGTVIAGRYLVISYLGEGMFSRVYECIDQIDESEQHVAIKVVRNDKSCLEAGLGEIRVLARMAQLFNSQGSSPPYARMRDYFYHKEHLFIVTDLLGCSLFRFNETVGVNPSDFFIPSRLAFIAFQLLTGLEVMHKSKLVHCDIKPDNVCFSSISQCTVKMIDFGACLCEHDVRNSYTQSRWYRAPEVMLGMQHDDKIDMWSLGCMMAELLLGYPVFQGDSVAKVLAAQHAVLGPYPPSLRRRIPEHPASAYFSPDYNLYEINPPGRRSGVYMVRPARPTLQELMPTVDPLAIEFISFLLDYDPVTRPGATEALQHPFITIHTPHMLVRQAAAASDGQASAVSDQTQTHGSQIEITPSSASQQQDTHARTASTPERLHESQRLWSHRCS